MSEHSPGVFVQHDLFGGQGEVTIWDLWGASSLDPFKAVLACALAPDGAVGRHVQQFFPEIIVFTSGSGQVEVDGMTRDIGPGALVSLALGQTLAIANTSSLAPLTYIIIKAATAVSNVPS